MRIAVRPCDRSVTVPVAASTRRLEHDAKAFVLVDDEEVSGREAEGRLASRSTMPPPAPSGRARPVTSLIAAISVLLLAGPGGDLDDRARPRLRRATTPTPRRDLAVGAGLPDRLERRQLLNHACGFPSGSKKWWLTISTGPKRLRSGSETKARVPCRDLPPLTSASANIFAERRRIAGRGDMADRAVRVASSSCSTICAPPFERAVVERDHADQLQRGRGATRPSRSIIIEPTNGFFFDSIQSRCRSRAVVRPSISAPVTWPFSMRSVPSASSP